MEFLAGVFADIIRFIGWCIVAAIFGALLVRGCSHEASHYVAGLVILALFVFGYLAIGVCGWRGGIVTALLVIAVFAGSIAWAVRPAW